MSTDKRTAAQQMLQDLKDLGYGEKAAPLIQLLDTNKKLRQDLQAKWNAHMYPESKMTFGQITISQGYMTLSSPALKVLVFLGMYAHQSGLIQVVQSDLIALTGVKRTAVKEVLKELVDAGAIQIAVASAQHKAPIYAVNPDVFVKGNRKVSRQFKASGSGDYILNRTTELMPHTEVINTGEMVYTRVSATTEKEPSEDVAASAKSSSRKSKRTTHHTKTPTDGQDDGQQMTVYDYPELIPDGVNDPNLPFN